MSQHLGQQKHPKIDHQKRGFGNTPVACRGAEARRIFDLNLQNVARPPKKKKRGWARLGKEKKHHRHSNSDMIHTSICIYVYM